jgi:hypothetical protein
MVKAMMEAAADGARRLDAHMAQMKMMCDHMDAIKCAADTAACQDEGAEADEEGQAMLECMCACPKIMDIGDDMSKVCDDKAGTVGCISSTSQCSAMAATMNEKEVDLGCEYTAKKCEKASEDLATCMGDDITAWATEKCDTEASEACCPLGKKMISCMGSDCYTISLAMQSMTAEKADASAEDKKEAKDSLEMIDKYRTTCPDAGLPSAAAVSATASEGKVSSGAAAGDSADFATPGQTVSVLAMAAVMAASLMA